MRVVVRSPTLVRRTEELEGVESAHDRQLAPKDPGLEVVYSDGRVERLGGGWTILSASGGPFSVLVRRPVTVLSTRTIDNVESVKHVGRGGDTVVRARTSMGSIVEERGDIRAVYEDRPAGVSL